MKGSVTVLDDVAPAGDAVNSAATAATAATPPDSRRDEHTASVAIAVIAFLIVTGETLPVGLLGDVAHGVHATPSQVGLVMSWYAAIAALTAVPATRAAVRLDRRHIIVACAGLFGLAHILAAAATNIPVLLVARAIAAMCHGLYFAVAGPSVIRIARPEAKGRAGGRVAVGATSALVVGTPIATAIGQAAGWRVAMLVVAALALGLAVVVARVLPALPPLHGHLPRSAGGVLVTLRSRALVVIFATLVVLVTAHFTFWTFISPYVDQELGIHGKAFTVLLLAYGVCAVVGSSLAGPLVDWGPLVGMRIAAGVWVVTTLGAWAATAAGLHAVAIGLLLLWGGLFSVLAPSVALAVLRRSNGPTTETANAIGGIVFQVGIVAGSALGALIFSTGHLAQIPLITAAGAVGVCAFLLSAGRAFRKGTVY